MGVVAFLILGIVVGLVVQAAIRGPHPGGFVATLVVGAAGALLGGFLAAWIVSARPLDDVFDIATWVAAVVGAVVLLVIYAIVAGDQPDETQV